MIIAAAQIAVRAGDFAHNLARHVAFVEQAAAQSLELLVFPELSLTGYELALGRTHAITPGDTRLAPLRAQATQHRMTIVAGAPLIAENDTRHIGALIFHPNGAVSTHAKQHVHSTEAPFFTAGPGGPLFAHYTALAICRDATFPEHAAAAAEQGARIYAASAFLVADDYPRKTALLQQYARQHRMATLLANYAGVTGGEPSAGRSAIWNERGDLIQVAPNASECLVVATANGLT